VSTPFTLSIVSFHTAVHVVSVSKLWYQTRPWIDIPIHIWGGITITIVFFWLFDRPLFHSGFRPSRGVVALFAISFVALVGVGWEFIEFLYDAFLAYPYHLQAAQLGLADTLADLLNDLMGGGIAVAAMYFLPKTRRALSFAHAHPIGE